MTDINQVVLIGRLTRDAELKYTNNGTPVSRISIAVNQRRKMNEQWVDEANFFNIVIWGKTAESLNPYLQKGKQIAVTGQLRQNRWEQDGQQRSRVEIVATNIQLLGGTRSGGQTPYGETGGGSFPDSTPDRTVETQNDIPDDFEDDIPF